MPKLVLLSDDEQILTQWMLAAGPNDQGHMTLREPAHLGTIVSQMQGALERDKMSFVFTDQKPYACEFCGRASAEEYCTTKCEQAHKDFPGGRS